MKNPFNPRLTKTRRSLILMGLGGTTAWITYAGMVAEIPDLSASLEALLSDNVTADGKATPGETIDFTATIKNDDPSLSTEATYQQTLDPNLTLVPGSVKATPLALNDTYACVGNVGINIPANIGLLANDIDPDGTNGGGTADLDIAIIDGTGTAGAVIANGSDGGFTYIPPAGFEGTDTFTYTITDADSLGDASTGDGVVTVTINVSGMVWFVDSSAASGGNGTLSSPFNSLAQQNNNTLDEDGECIFIAPGTYDGGIILQANQGLIGSGSTQSLEDFCSLTLPAGSFALPATSVTSPVIRNSSGNALALSSGNTVRGINIGDTTGAGIFASNFGTATVSEVDITSSGQALDMATGILNSTFGTITKTGGDATGIALNAITGSADLGTLDITCTGTGTGLSITGNSSGITCAADSMLSTVGTALAVTSSTLGSGSPMVMESITSTGGSLPGINLNAMSGGLTVTGTGTTDGSGGSISGKTDTDAVILSDTAGLVSLANLVITDIAATNDASAAIGTRSGVDGIHGFNVSGGLVLTNCDISNISDNAISGGTLATTPAPAIWDGLEIRNCTFNNTNRFHIADRGDDSSEGIVRIRGLTGTVVIDASTISNGGRGFDVTTPTTTGTLDLTVQRSAFSEIYKEFASGGTTNVGGRGISVVAEGSHNAVVRIGDPSEASSALGNTFTNCATASVVVAGQEGGASPHTGNMDVVISRNTFLVDDHSSPQTPPGSLAFNFPQGGVSVNPAGSGDFETIVSHNLFDQCMHAAGAFGQFAFGHNAGSGTSELIANDNEFKLPWDAAVTLRADDNGNSLIAFSNNTYTDGVVGSASDDLGGSFPSPYQGFLTDVRNGGSQQLRLLNEILPQQDDVNGGGFFTFFADVRNDAGNFLMLHLDDCKAPDGYRLINGASTTFELFREDSADTTPTTIVQGNGNTGGGGQAGVPNPAIEGSDNLAVVSVTGTVFATDFPPTAPNIVIP